MTKRLSIHDVAFKGNSARVAKFLKAGIHADVRDSTGRCPIHHCASNGHAEVARVLIRAGANLDIQCRDHNNTALFIACGYGHTALAKVLIAAGANPNLTCGENQLTAMHMGCINKHYDLVRELVEAGGDLTIRTAYGSTVLHAAVSNRVFDPCRFLISLPGVNLDVRDKQGNTLLMRSAEHDMTGETAEMLLNAGADMLLIEPNGLTAFMGACF